MKKWKTLSSKIAFDQKWFPIQKDKVRLPNGTIVDDFYVWNKMDVVLVVGITSESKIILVKQYKHAGKDFFIEAPAGYLNEGEKSLDGAIREFGEETGYASDKYELLGRLMDNPAKATSNIFIYLAQNVKKSKKQKLDHNEEIEVIELPINEILSMIYSGKIRVTGTVSGIFLALNKIGYK